MPAMKTIAVIATGATGGFESRSSIKAAIAAAAA
jgi:hypothetical protein